MKQSTRGKHRILAACLLALAAPAWAADPEVHVLPVADRAPGERRPLLIYLHGLGGSGAEALANPELRALAERGRMFLVAPDGFLDREGRHFWNAGPACCNLDGKAVNDVARLEALIYHWRERPEIDPARVYVVGFSNGGFMAHRLACFMDDRLAAIVSIGGAGRAREEACGPTTAIAVAEIHGDADPIVAYGGGRIFNDHALDPHPSSRDTFTDWAERLGCLSQVGKTGKTGKPGKTGNTGNTGLQVTTADLDPRLPGAETTIESYADCPLGTAELWTVHGGGHQVMTPALMRRVGDFLAANPKGAPEEKPKRAARKKRR